MNTFHEKLKDLRIAKGLNRHDLAKSLGVSPSAIGMYETGTRMPSIKIIHKIVILFEVDFNYLLDTDYSVGDLNNNKWHSTKELTVLRSGADQFLQEHPEYHELFESIKLVKKDEINFVKTMIEKLT